MRIVGQARAQLALLLPWIGGCSASAEPRFLSLAGIDAELVLPLVIAADGAWSGSDTGIVLDAAPAAVRYRMDPAERLLLLGLRRAELSAITPRFDAAREAEVVLTPQAPARCIEGQLDLSHRTLHTSVPENISILEASFEAEGARWVPADATTAQRVRDASLELPVAEEQCGTGRRASFEPYADDALPIPLGLMLGGVAISGRDLAFSALHRLADDRLLLAGGGQTVFLLERSRPFDGSAGSWVRLPSSDDLMPRALAVDESEARKVDGKARAYLGLARGDGSLSAIEELRIGPSGLEWVATSTLVAGYAIASMVVDPSTGRLVVAAAPGLVLTKLPDAIIRVVPLPGMASSTNDPVAALTGLADLPFALLSATTNLIMLGDPTAEQWDPLGTEGIDAGVRLRSLGHFRDPAGPELWAGAGDGVLYRKAHGAAIWERHLLRLPSALAGSCSPAPSACGWGQLSTNIRGLFPVAGAVPHVHLAIVGCRAVLEVRRDLKCATYLPIGEGTLSAPEGGDFRFADQNDRWLTVSNRDGEVWALDLNAE
ncbi:MAG: hypothetical protein IT384_01570 [Deltaproteobacteria bacterium]|nr:hypothetical protein [Deltaproteobacteria bacterium]